MRRNISPTLKGRRTPRKSLKSLGLLRLFTSGGPNFVSEVHEYQAPLKQAPSYHNTESAIRDGHGTTFCVNKYVPSSVVSAAPIRYSAGDSLPDLMETVHSRQN